MATKHGSEETTMETRYVTNDRGERVGVILDIEEYERLREAAEDFEYLRAADETFAAVERGEEDPLPFDAAVKEMEEERRRLRKAGKVPDDPEG
jgi:hypothetical protein